VIELTEAVRLALLVGTGALVALIPPVANLFLTRRTIERYDPVYGQADRD
jgi:hypothetical protein